MGQAHRRKFLIAAGGFLAAPRACTEHAFAQGKVVTVGVLNAYSPPDYAARLEQLRKGLHDLGYVEGRNLRLETRYAYPKLERLPQLATELAALPASANPSVWCARDAAWTKTARRTLLRSRGSKRNSALR